MIRMIFSGLVAVLLVAGCSNSLQPVSPADVAGVETEVTIAETLALNYTSLPPCPGPVLCADPVAKAKIKTYGQAAHDAVKTLQKSSAAGAPAALASAQAALTAFQRTIPVPK